MARKRHTAEEIVAKLRQVDVLMARVARLLERTCPFLNSKPRASLA